MFSMAKTVRPMNQVHKWIQRDTNLALLRIIFELERLKIALIYGAQHEQLPWNYWIHLFPMEIESLLAGQRQPEGSSGEARARYNTYRWTKTILRPHMPSFGSL